MFFFLDEGKQNLRRHWFLLLFFKSLKLSQPFLPSSLPCDFSHLTFHFLDSLLPLRLLHQPLPLLFLRLWQVFNSISLDKTTLLICYKTIIKKKKHCRLFLPRNGTKQRYNLWITNLKITQPNNVETLFPQKMKQNREARGSSYTFSQQSSEICSNNNQN